MEFASTAPRKQAETEINSLPVLNQPFTRRGIKHDNPGGGQRCVCARVCACVSVCMRVRASMRACVCGGVSVIKRCV